MSWFPISNEDWNKEAYNPGSTDHKEKSRKRRRGTNITQKTPLPLTRQQADDRAFKKMGQIREHGILDIKKAHIKRQHDAKTLCLEITQLLDHKLPKNYDLATKRDQNRALKIVSQAKLFQHDLEVLPFLKVFIFPPKPKKGA